MKKVVQRTFGNGMTIQYESAKVKQIEKPENLCYMDELHMKNGDVWLLTKANSGEVELMLKTRKTIKKNDVPTFLEGMSFLKRAECFDLAS
jgi:hypothetical protein